MGFTPFPYDIGPEAQEWTYETVLEHGDFVAHHLDTGIPWQEALDRAPYPALVEANLAERLAHTPEGRVVYLAVTPISTLRDGLSQYWSNEGQKPLEEPWAGRRFSDPRVFRAYLRYCLDLIDRFDPEYMAYAVEVDLLARNDPQAFADFRRLAKKIYRRIKRRYPDLQVFFTFTLGQPGGWEEIRDIVRPLLGVTDVLAISTYPYLAAGFDGDPRKIPEDWFEQVRELDPDKPFAIAETGYAAEPVVFETFDVTIPASRAWQRLYMQRLMRELQALDAEFVVWFTVVDYDRLWDLMEEAGVSELFKAWRDTGLYDQDLRKRPAARVWDRWLHRPLE